MNVADVRFRHILAWVTLARIGTYHIYIATDAKKRQTRYMSMRVSRCVLTAYWKVLRKWKLNRAFKGVYMMYALFFVKSLNGLNKVLSAFKTKKPSKIKGLRGVF